MIDQASKDLAEVFRDVEMHQKINGIIRNRTTNAGDIRESALKGFGFSNVKTILDLGCGFGFFTRMLKGRTVPEAKITGIDCHPGYRDSYLDSCRHAEIMGEFIGECITSIRRIKSNTIDLILCSYALYFFPEILPQISRILKDNGTFITITHSRYHLRELGLLVKGVLSDFNFNQTDELPYETLIEKFSAENGIGLLKPWFGSIQTEKHPNSLVFTRNDIAELEAYLRFKPSFFIPETGPEKEEFISLVLDSFKEVMKEDQQLSISKNDIIFSCNVPLMKGRMK